MNSPVPTKKHTPHQAQQGDSGNDRPKQAGDTNPISSESTGTPKQQTGQIYKDWASI